MSLQDYSPQHRAATIIQRNWRGYVCRKVFKYFKVLINHYNQGDPKMILKAVNPREAELLDAAAGVFIRFRLGGNTFPPNIYYKIFTHRPIADICAFSPKDYTQPGLKRPVARQTNNGWPLVQEDRSGWYQRMENNSWRPFCCKAVPTAEPFQIGANKKLNFHFSKLRRQHEVDKWRKRRKIEWLKQMYNQGRLLETDPAHQDMATQVRNSAQEIMNVIEEEEDDEILEWEVDELLAWTKTLNFEDYMEEWSCLACSQSSEPVEDVPLHPLMLEPHEFAGVADEDS